MPGAVPGFWTTLTLICGLRLSGVSAPFVFPGATDTATFETYVGQALAPQLHPGDVVIWDNLAPHKAQSVVKAVERAGESDPVAALKPGLLADRGDVLEGERRAEVGGGAHDGCAHDRDRLYPA